MKNFFAPSFFYKIPRIVIAWLGLLLVALMCAALYQALFVSPVDYQQGQMVRMMYVHVPSAWMALSIYVFIAILSFVCIVWKIPMCYIISASAAPIGATFAAITLITGSIWGRPIWGTWWVWDARLTSMLVLFMIYVAYIIVVRASDIILRAEKPASVIAIIGFVNVPIVKFSVEIWHSLHQPASILKMSGPSIHESMLLPLGLMFMSFIVYFLLALFMRVHFVLKIIKQK